MYARKQPLQLCVLCGHNQGTLTQIPLEQFLLKIKVVKFGNRKMTGKSPAWWENFG
jgi:hypothetical protein